MKDPSQARWCAPFDRVFAPALFASALAGASLAYAGSAYFSPGNLVVSRSVYDNNPDNGSGRGDAAAKLRHYFMAVCGQLCYRSITTAPTLRLEQRTLSTPVSVSPRRYF